MRYKIEYRSKCVLEHDGRELLPDSARLRYRLVRALQEVTEKAWSGRVKRNQPKANREGVGSAFKRPSACLLGSVRTKGRRRPVDQSEGGDGARTRTPLSLLP